MSTMDIYFSFKFIQLQLSKMLMNNKVLHLRYSLLVYCTFQCGNSRLVDIDKSVYTLKELMLNCFH
jgi:hypothetical protein